MKTRQEIVALLRNYAEAVKKIYGPILSKMVLYGSYARGDYHEDSDVDVMILLDVPPKEERKRLDDVAAITSDFNMEHDLDIEPLVHTVALFQKWEKNYPFFSNIKKTAPPVREAVSLA